ncbi:MAG: NADH:ubiquinone oxidoreductase [Clostridiales bacterium]|nr:MAG: NADH:ubiquinone oxidoreductase [Clostridiales bacterium]
MINININGKDLQVAENTTILEAAKLVNARIPTLCHMNLHELKVHNQIASCRICMVEVEGRRTLVPSCSEKCTEGMVIKTHTPRALNARRMAVQLLLSNHPKDCLSCEMNLDCELQKLAAELNITGIKFQGEMMDFEVDTSSKAIVKNPNKCVMCRRCETMCNIVQSCGVLSAINRGFDAFVGPAFNVPMVESSCTFCGQCVAVCPTAALVEVDHSKAVWRALSDEKKHVIVQTAPAIRVAIGEEFGMQPGEISTGKLAASLRALGFDGVFDTDFAADLTIMEEASELVHRIQHDGKLPILTSCCPAWVNFFEHHYPDLLDVPSSCQSPQIMFGSIAKTYYAKKMGIDPKDIFVVSVMPCLAKKAEAQRPELFLDGMPRVDAVVTTREYAKMLKQAGIDFANLEEEDFDKIMGESTGAGVIFGTTGGVIEAACRTAYEWITGEELAKLEFTDLRGLEGVRSAKIKLGDMDINIGIAHGLSNAARLLDSIKAGEVDLQAIEIMACPGGCIGGGGQPYHHGNVEIIEKRQAALYREDQNKTRRKSHENQEVMKLYKEFLGEPYGEKAHQLLHTNYFPQRTL